MPLISVVGRKSLKVRLLVLSLYTVLSLGAVTMVYPFLLMISGSFKTDVDKDDWDAIPKFWRESTTLYRKHLECKYNNTLTELNASMRSKEYDFRSIEPPAERPEQKVKDWKEFEETAELPASFYSLGYMQHPPDRMRLWKHREFRQKLMELCGDDIHEFNRRFDTQEESWLNVGSVIERLTERRYQLSGGAMEKAFYEFKQAQAPWFRFYPSLDGKFVQTYIETQYSDIEAYNSKHGTSFPDFRHVILARTAPEDTLGRQEWEKFVREELNLQFLRVSKEARPLFTGFVRKRYLNDIRLLNKRYSTAFRTFAEVAFPEDVIHASPRMVDWGEFIKQVPVEYLLLSSPEIRFRDFLQKKYKDDLAALNRAHGAAYTGFDFVPMPIRQVDYADFLSHESQIRTEFLLANYRQVIDYIFFHGRSLWNTLVYCALAILVTLTVNPLAAYALSRFNLPSTYKILLFCMATMAFPSAVTMIPNFLLLKKLGLLNTYAALVLPGMANGYGIFLLKGFFDSLPREIYESATIDGAGEWTMFWQFTMALSKPILAVLGLGAFTQAYGNFMFAFILCPDEKMWTLMVFLYQLQIGGHMGLTFAALLVAAVPTFLVFVFCQNIIIRGIVVPVEK